MQALSPFVHLTQAGTAGAQACGVGHGPRKPSRHGGFQPFLTYCPYGPGYSSSRKNKRECLKNRRHPAILWTGAYRMARLDGANEIPRKPLSTRVSAVQVGFLERVRITGPRGQPGRSTCP